MEDLNLILEAYLTGLNNFLKNILSATLSAEENELYKIFRYHLGLDDPTEKQGKRLRAILTLLCCEGTGTEWRTALPAAAAIELIHNFSLIHDDIEDNGAIRRGKTAVWKHWGLAKGLNAGDAMFALAFQSLGQLRDNVRNEITLDAFELLGETCLKLTNGQHMDIDFESRDSVELVEYLEMISGKTAALFSCCTRMGALIGGLDHGEQTKFSQYGQSLGMAFQIYDDWLGVWGNPILTGKTATGDIIERKKTMPIILGLKKSPRFAVAFREENISFEIATNLATWLREDGIEDQVINAYKEWTNKANRLIGEMQCSKSVRNILAELTNKLLIRKK